GSTKEQSIAFQTRSTSFTRCISRQNPGSGSVDRRNPSASPHDAGRFLQRPSNHCRQQRRL
ncbi:LSU ribosomal protein L32p @ LSU ribosomal protein L32p, zinc-independent, partial [Methylomonas albis]